MAEIVKKWARVSGDDRDAMKGEAKRLYEEGQMSVRQVAEHIDRSYGATHRLLIEAGVTFRPRGFQRADA